MDDNWGDSSSYNGNIDSNSTVDTGTNFSRGRGFTRIANTNPGFSDTTGEEGWGSSNDNWGSNQRGGGRGGRGGRGRGGGGRFFDDNGRGRGARGGRTGGRGGSNGDSFTEDGENASGNEDKSQTNDDAGGGWSGNNENGGWGDVTNNNSEDRGGRGRGRGRGGRGRGGGGGGRGYRNSFDSAGDDNWGGNTDSNDNWSSKNNDGDDNTTGDDWGGGGGGDGASGGSRGGRGRGRGGRGRGGGGRGGASGGGFGDGEEGGGGGTGEDTKPRERYIPPEPTNDENEMFSTAITTGINFANFDNIPVEVTGNEKVPPVNSFEDAGLRPIVLDNIKKSGYTRPTPIQKNAIPLIMAGRDVMACAQTGSGKTAAFLLPMINQLIADKVDLICNGQFAEPQVVILSPTRELTMQIYNEARKFAHGSVIKTVVTYGGTSISYQLRHVEGGCHILVATPGRMKDFVNRGKISFASVRYVVLDEADRMLDLGFQPEIENMMCHETMVPKGERQTLMFSATFPTEIQQLAARYLNDYVFITIGIVGGACTDVQQEFIKVSHYDKREELLNLLQKSGKQRTLVFVETKRNADFMACYLSSNKLRATSIHGDRLQSERETALKDFKSGSRDILVATDVAARGLDIKNVQHVINFDLPKNIDEYVHRIGRTGRLGNRGKATSFFESGHDGQIAGDLVRILRQAEQPIPDWLETAGASGGSSNYTYGAQGFGGRDVRDDFTAPANYEPEEEW